MIDNVDLFAVARDSNGQIDPKTLAFYLDLLISNVAPQAAELPSIQAVVSKDSARLTYLQDEIARLRHQLKELEEEHAQLSRYHAQNLGILSPLRRMPPEILGEIFSWTLPSAQDALELGRFDIRSSPWVLTHVSRRWRTVSMSTPSLWSLVCLQYISDSPPRRRSRYPLPMLEAQISRARSLKVHFIGWQYFEPQLQIVLFKTLMKHSAAWEELSLRLTPEICALLPTLRDCVPSLRRLYLCCQWNDMRGGIPVESIDTFQTAPSLLDVGIYNESRYVPIHFPAHQLTRYQLGGPWATHETILRSAPNLVEAHIMISFDHEPWPEEGDTITLPRLQRLYVSHVQILGYLRTPDLQGIALACGGGEDFSDIQPFVVRSACNLRRICFRGNPAAHFITEVLQEYSSITELGIMDWYHTEETHKLISQLTIPSPTGNTELSTRLSIIVFKCPYTSYIDCARYLRMLETRWRAPGSALKSAALFIDRGPNLLPEMLDGFSSLRAEGVDFVLLQGSRVASEGQDMVNDWLYTTRWR